MKTKILFVSMYGIESNSSRLLSAILKNNNYNVETIFLKNWKNNNIKEPTSVEFNLLFEEIARIKPDIIGISFGSPYFNIVKTISYGIKHKFKNIYLVFGGIHATTVPEDCIKYCDALCIGEGDKAFLEFVNKFENKINFTDTSNFWFNFKNNIIKNQLTSLVENLDKLPFKDLSNEKKYYIDYDRIYPGDPILNIKEFRISASRGCFYRCAYCYNSVLSKIYPKEVKYYRTRSVDNVIDEILYAKKHFKAIKRVKFDDDTFISDSQWIDDFCTKYKKLINIPFDIMISPHMLNYGNLKKLQKAGLVRAQMGIEGSSAKENIEEYNRAFLNDKIYDFSIKNKKLKLDIVYDIIIDNPMTTEKEKEGLFLFLLSLQSKFKLFMYSLAFFPKTLITESFLKQGLINVNNIEGNSTKCFSQFRASFDYARPKTELFYFCMFVLVSKSFIPKTIKKYIFYSRFFRKNIGITVFIAKICNLMTIILIFVKMLVNGELSVIKLREYGNFKKILTQ
ncbi:MAG: cobalamin-dependent protein [Endomicrobiaceae bacterium]|nr:cobalamin-dependent protein [Endomicrobiaceae bacterium]